MSSDRPPYRDASRPVDVRVRDLLGRMRLDEKVAQLGGVWSTQLLDGDRLDLDRAVERLRHGTGHVTRIGAATVLGPAQSARFANELQGFLREHTRLGIPAVVHEESLAGYCAKGATCFPQAIGLAATFDPDLVHEVARVIRAQLRAVGAHQTLAPVLDVARDPRWGRTEETYGEDPYLASRIGVGYVRGMQGDDLRTGVAATGKHFVGYGASEGGLNWAPSHLPRRELVEVYCAPFEAAIREAGLASVMNAYHEHDGIPCGASAEILDDLLRGELGFDGVVVADYFTVATLESYHRVAETKGEAARRALEAGLDVELPALDCFAALPAEIEAGRLDPALVDRAVARVLRQKVELGLFEDPFVDAAAAPAVFDTAEQRALARRAAAASIVLLRNEGDLLPLDPALGAIAVVGPCARSARALQGDYHYPAHAEITFGPVREAGDAPQTARSADDGGLQPGRRRGGVDLADHAVPMVTVAEGIRARVAPATRVLEARGCDWLDDDRGGFDEAVAAARAADVAVVVVGDRSGLVEGCTSGESVDRAELTLPGVQEDLVRAVSETGTPTVVVLVNGRPPVLTAIAGRAGAIVEAWLPGEEAGSAIAGVLFGDVSPGGRLPISLPRSVGQLPVYYRHKPSGGRTQWKGDYADGPTRPLYPFGHGLGYTRFEYAALALSAERVPATGGVEVRVRILNVGDRDGDEVVQLYVRDEVASVTRPVRQLAGFRRVQVPAGGARALVFHLDCSQLALLDAAHELVVEPGGVEVLVGSSSQDIRLRGRFEITGARRELRRDELVATRVEVV